MKRHDFIKVCSLLGISSPTQLFSDENNTKFSNSSETVLIIGSGAAGMSAGYLLDQEGINYKILEASNSYGGRMKHTSTFADFPIPLGAEWLHVSKKELAKIVNDKSTTISNQFKGYSRLDSVGYYEDGELSYSTIVEEFGFFFNDKKFVNSTWFDFFDQYIVPRIHKNIQFNTQIKTINYQEDKVIITDSKDKNYKADRVIVTVPLKILKKKMIKFIPSLPKYKLEAIQDAPVWSGIKVFLEFTKKFYPTYLTFPDSETSKGQRLYFDAAYAQNTSSNILGLFAVGKQAKQYQKKSKKDQLDYILNELDQIFEGKASRTYKKHIVQDWDDEEFIQSAYLADHAPSYISYDLFTPLKDKLFFAGESYTYEDDWGSVHNATQSARNVVEYIINS